MSLAVRDLEYRWPRAGAPVFAGISFDARGGEITSVIGPNGMGKTTMLKVIAGILRGRGEVRADGPIAYMTQEPPLPTSLTSEQVVLLGMVGEMGIRVKSEQRERARRALEMVGMAHAAEVSFRELSGGTRRAVRIAQTLARDPHVMLMDEPTANLDMKNELEAIGAIRRYVRERGAAAVLVLHDLNAASRCSDRVVLMKRAASGEAIAVEGKPAEVLTEENISEAYGVRVKVWVDSRGVPTVHPMSAIES